jgi:HAD superfamily hydrolase (TIGR01458 family)
MSLPFHALFFDLSGVLFQEQKAIEGAGEIIKMARSCDKTLRFITNTASKNQTQIIQQLEGYGIQIEAHELFSAPKAAKQYLLDNNLRPFCLIHENLESDFQQLEQTNPNCVLIGESKKQLHFDNLNLAFNLCQQGNPLIAIGKNKYYRSAHGLCLEAGAFIHGLEWASGQQAIIMGKPSVDFFQQVVDSTPYSAEQCLMIGDDIEGDVIAASKAGLSACLVKTGKFQPADLDRLPQQAMVIDSIAKLII